MSPTCRVEGRDKDRRQTILILPTSALCAFMYFFLFTHAPYIAQAEKSGGGKLMFEDEMRALHHGGDTNTEVLYFYFLFREIVAQVPVADPGHFGTEPDPRIRTSE
jgi:hypothetical protein